MIIAVGTGNQVAGALPELETLLREPLFTVERVQLCKRDGELLDRPAALPASDDRGRALWQKLMVYTSEATLHNGAPIHRAWSGGCSIQVPPAAPPRCAACGDSTARINRTATG